MTMKLKKMQTEVHVFFMTCFLFTCSSPPPIFTSSLENDLQIPQQIRDKPEDGFFHSFSETFFL